LWQNLVSSLSSFLTQPWTVVVMGLAVAALCFVLGRSFLRRPAGPAASALDLLPRWVGDRRTGLRRKGNVVVVDLDDPVGKVQEQSGCVLDRSTGGLRLLVHHAVEVGTLLRVRPRTGGDTLPWSEVTVRSCQLDSGIYQRGLQFLKTPGYNTLMMFG
jgi:hypothetical protein